MEICLNITIGIIQLKLQILKREICIHANNKELSLMRKKVSIFLCVLYVVFMAFVAVQLFLKDNDSDALIALGGVACGLIPLLIILLTKFELSLPIIIFISYFFSDRNFLVLFKDFTVTAGGIVLCISLAVF